MPSPETTITVESALAELREIARTDAVTISHFQSWSRITPDRENWSVSILGNRWTASTLIGAMDQAREYTRKLNRND